MRIGRLRHRVTFEEQVTAQDEAGQPVITWVAAFPRAISADIMPLSGKELIAAQGEQSKVSSRIKVRYRPGFSSKMRGVHRGTVYNIEAVIPDTESGVHWITLLCSSGANEG